MVIFIELSMYSFSLMNFLKNKMAAIEGGVCEIPLYKN